MKGIWIMRKFITILFIFILTGCGSNSGLEDNDPVDNSLKEKVNLVSVDDVTLFGGTTEGDSFTEITVKTSNNQTNFPWSNVKNETYFPTLKITDVDLDGKNEIIVILTKGYGTGVHEQEIHVLKKEDLNEIPAENPIEFLNNNAKSEITKANEKVNVVLEIGDKKFEKSYDESFVGSWNEKVGFGSIVNYELVDNKIIAVVPGSVSPSEFAVSVKLEYGSDLKVKNIILEEQ
jgi:hypothetical protein